MGEWYYGGRSWRAERMSPRRTGAPIMADSGAGGARERTGPGAGRGERTL